MKAPGEHVKLRCVWGPVPEAGDELRFRTGRRYLVLQVRGKTLRCIVLGKDEPVTGPVLAWEWASRRRRG